MFDANDPIAVQRALDDAVRAKNVAAALRALASGAIANAADAFGITPMHRAASLNDEHMVLTLARHGASTTHGSSQGVSAFTFAAMGNNVPMMRLLARFGLDLERTGCADGRLLDALLQAELMEAASWVVAHGGDIECPDEHGETLLVRAIKLQSPAAVELLTNAGAQVTEAVVRAACTHLPACAMQLRSSLVRQPAPPPRTFDDIKTEWVEGRMRSNEHPPMSRSWLEARFFALNAYRTLARWPGVRGERAQPLHKQLMTLVQNGDATRTLALISSTQVDVEWRDRSGTPLIFKVLRAVAPGPALGVANLHAAAGRLQPAAWGQLISAMLNKMRRPALRDCATGNTILHEAVLSGHEWALAAVLNDTRFHVCLNLSNEELNRPLHLAAKINDARMTSVLALAGADVNVLNRQGFAPMHLCGALANKDVGKTLISAGANLDLRTRGGHLVDDLLPRGGQADGEFVSMIAHHRASGKAQSLFSPNNEMAGLLRLTKSIRLVHSRAQRPAA